LTNNVVFELQAGHLALYSIMAFISSGLSLRSAAW
jgi:hypothetical protein